jgi:hypothetical protein
MKVGAGSKPRSASDRDIVPPPVIYAQLLAIFVVVTTVFTSQPPIDPVGEPPLGEKLSALKNFLIFRPALS